MTKPTQADRELCGFLIEQCMTFRVTNDGTLKTVFNYVKAEQAIADHVAKETQELQVIIERLTGKRKYITHEELKKRLEEDDE
jgi:molybdenum cofactor biosynthesis enzyme MoaA